MSKLIVFDDFGLGTASAPCPGNDIFRTEATSVTDFQEWFWLIRTEATSVTDFQEWFWRLIRTKATSVSLSVMVLGY